ncbi:mycofactocin precursor [Nocardiopsis gilva YIM 90087]|uniref:Mycofactocin n=1 Tax=Nocardiopsis gilva YIM 90087 TaxID=1235441 RepID=A0A223S7M1_9ACTN|nr:mycofactocin precursor [Nocardiopsis gilva YIM 90087]
MARTVGEGNTMSPEPAMPVPAPLDPQTGPSGDYEDLVDDELLVEDVSIDGMCGVY